MEKVEAFLKKGNQKGLLLDGTSYSYVNTYGRVNLAQHKQTKIRYKLLDEGSYGYLWGCRYLYSSYNYYHSMSWLTTYSPEGFYQVTVKWNRYSRRIPVDLEKGAIYDIYFKLAAYNICDVKIYDQYGIKIFDGQFTESATGSSVIIPYDIYVGALNNQGSINYTSHMVVYGFEYYDRQLYSGTPHSEKVSLAFVKNYNGQGDDTVEDKNGIRHASIHNGVWLEDEVLSRETIEIQKSISGNARTSTAFGQPVLPTLTLTLTDLQEIEIDDTIILKTNDEIIEYWKVDSISAKTDGTYDVNCNHWLMNIANINNYRYSAVHDPIDISDDDIFWDNTLPYSEMGSDLFQTGQGDFETSTGGWVSGSGCDIRISTVISNTGTHSLEVYNGNSSYSMNADLTLNSANGLTQNLTDGKTYLLEWYQAVDLGTNSTPYIEFYDGANLRKWKLFGFPDVGSGASEMQKCTLLFTKQPGGNAFLRMQLGSQDNKMYLDTISIKEATTEYYIGGDAKTNWFTLKYFLRSLIYVADMDRIITDDVDMSSIIGEEALDGVNYEDIYIPAVMFSYVGREKSTDSEGVGMWSVVTDILKILMLTFYTYDGVFTVANVEFAEPTLPDDYKYKVVPPYTRKNFKYNKISTKYISGFSASSDPLTLYDSSWTELEEDIEKSYSDGFVETKETVEEIKLPNHLMLCSWTGTTLEILDFTASIAEKLKVFTGRFVDYVFTTRYGTIRAKYWEYEHKFSDSTVTYKVIKKEV